VHGDTRPVVPQALFLGAGGAAGRSPPPPVAVLSAVQASVWSQLQLYWPHGITEPPSR
jgi:hypothetical protein